MFDFGQELCHDGSEISEKQTARFIDGLCEEFAGSPEAAAIQDSGQSCGYAWNFLDLFFGYVGGHPAEMTARDFEEVVFDLFPRKLSTEPESAGAIIAEMRAFLAFLHRQYAHRRAAEILKTIAGNGAVERLRTKLSDESNFGMAKSFVMQGAKLGFDMTTAEGLLAFQKHFNSEVAAKLASPPEPRTRPSIPPLPHIFARGFAWEPSTTSTRADRKAKKAKRQGKKRNRGR